MSTVLVFGLGEVGIRASRQLIDTPGVDRVIVADRHLEHAREVATALHDGAEPYRLGRDDPLPEELDAVVTALPGDADASLARRAVAAGIPFASAADRDATLRALLALDTEARAHGASVVAGCGLAPGLTDVLARHAVGALDAVDELHVARWGVAGAESAAEARRAQREEAREWRDGELVHEKHRSAELIWFPDPVGARECELVATGVAAGGGQSGRGPGHRPPRSAAHPPVHTSGASGSRPRLGCGPGRGLGMAGDRPHVGRLRGHRAHRGRGRHGAGRDRRVAGGRPARARAPSATGVGGPRGHGRAGAVPRRAGPARGEGRGLRGRRRRVTVP